MGYVNLFWFGPLFLFLLHGIGRYRCSNLEEIRADMEAIMRKAGDRPVLLCSNHLTMIDSMLITAFAFSVPTYLLRYRRFPWNVPEFRNFGKNLPLKAMCYLGKCIFVERSGTIASKKRTWQKVRTMLRRGDLVNIFPEGGRSRSGRVDLDRAVYGIGHLLQSVPDCLVVCVYVRGNAQRQYSFFPKRGDTFHMRAKLIEPTTTESGRRGVKDLTLQVMGTLKGMEEEYFASRQ